MQIDKEYDAMKKLGASAVDALISLWQKYPDMREYIAEKYKETTSSKEPLYIFKD